MPCGLWLRVAATHMYICACIYQHRHLPQACATRKLKQTLAPPNCGVHGHAQALWLAYMQLLRPLAQRGRDAPSRLKFSSFTLSITCNVKQLSLHLSQITLWGRACRVNQYKAKDSQYKAHNSRGPKQFAECQHEQLAVVVMTMDGYLIRHPQVLDGIPADVCLWYAPEAVTILQK